MNSAPITSNHSCPKCGAQMEHCDRITYLSDCPECGYSTVFSGDLEAYKSGNGETDEVLQRCIGYGIPREYLAYTAETAELIEAIENGQNVWISGDVGTGKSVLAANVGRDLIARGYRVRWISAAQAIQDERAAITNGAPSRWQTYCTVPILILDDVGKANATDYTASLLFTLAEARTSNGLPTIATSNYSGGKLIERLTNKGDTATAQAIVSRLVGGSCVVHMGGKDRRLTA